MFSARQRLQLISIFFVDSSNSDDATSGDADDENKHMNSKDYGGVDDTEQDEKNTIDCKKWKLNSVFVGAIFC